METTTIPLFHRSIPPSSQFAFGAALQAPGPPHSRLESDLRRAVDLQQFRVFFQPIFSLKTGWIAGFEALVRWQHPTRGLLPPADFLPVTEEAGLIVPIGLFVLREASLQMHRWHRRFPKHPPLLLCANLSARQFQQPDLVEQVSQILSETGWRPENLKLEITETLVMQNPESARAMLLELRALNVKLGIDDFGTGYSSLSYLQKFPVHTLKIDRSFIARLQDDKETLEIVRAIVTLAHNLGLDVVAEGVEAAGQVAMLKILQCDYGQGYFCSEPVDAERAEALIVRQAQAQGDMSAMDAPRGEAPAQGHVLDSNEVCMAQYSSEGSSASMLNPTELVNSVRVHFDNRDHQALTGISQNKKGFTLLIIVAAAAVLLGATMDVWSLRQPSQNATASSETRRDFDKANAPADGETLVADLEAMEKIRGHVIRPDSFDHLARNNQRKPKEESASSGRVSGFEPKHPTAQAGGVGSDASKSKKQPPQALRYSVIHDHFRGGCRGNLRISSESIVFAPAENSKHGFAFKPAAIVGTELGDMLKIRFKDRTYRFKARFARDKQDNRSKLALIDQRLTRARAEVGLAKR